jgi:hypothetical protein
VEGAPPIINTGESGPPSAGLTGPSAPPVTATPPAQPFESRRSSCTSRPSTPRSPGVHESTAR